MSAARSLSWRVLVGASSFADAQSALDLVERLVGPRLSGLRGVFLEQEFIAELPSQRMVTPGGSLVNVPSREQLGILFERDAVAFRKRVSDIARNHAWEFERRRGELIGGLFEAAGSWDLLLVGYNTKPRPREHVVLIAPPPDASQRSVELAQELAQVLGADLSSLDLDSDRPGARLAPESPRHFGDLQALLSYLSRLPAAALVLDIAAGPVVSADDLRRLRMAARCPMIILGAPPGDPRLGPNAAQSGT